MRTRTGQAIPVLARNELAFGWLFVLLVVIGLPILTVKYAGKK